MSAKNGNPIYDYAHTYVIMYEFANRISPKFLKYVDENCEFDVSEFREAVYIMALERLTVCRSDKVEALVARLEG